MINTTDHNALDYARAADIVISTVLRIGLRPIRKTVNIFKARSPSEAEANLRNNRDLAPDSRI